MPYRPIILALLLTLLFGLGSQAQNNNTSNLLQNPGFEQAGNYVDQRPSGSTYAFAMAPSWSGWMSRSPSTASWMNIEPIAYPHSGSSRYEGYVSQNIGRGDATWTAAVYQTVSGITDGTSLRFSVWVFQDSENGSGSQTRVGIGSNVGGNPLGTPITWSSWMTAIDSWQNLTVDATVPAGSVTVFIYSTQSQPKAQNQNYYDQSSLTVTGGGGQVNVGAGQATGTANVPPPPTSTPIQLAPAVAAQATQESGRIEHRVQSGDTLAAISVAYRVPEADILRLNNLSREQARFIQVGQVLVISEGNPNPPTDEPVATAEAQEVAATTEEAAGFASPTVQEAAATNTTAPTNTPESTNTPEASPTATDIPPSPTDAPDAPVEEGEETDPLNVEAGVCLIMFDDANKNNLQDDGEEALEGGTISINDSAGNNAAQYITDGTEPECLQDLPVGVYTVRATAPDGYGLPRSILSLSVQAGTRFTLSFAAVEGLQVAVVPTTSTVNEEPEVVEESPEDNSFRNLAGIIVLGLAGVVLIGGIGVGVIMSRRK